MWEQLILTKILAMLVSRRFWVAVLGAVALIAKEFFGVEVPTDTLLAFVMLLVGWIVGDSLHNTQIPRQ